MWHASASSADRSEPSDSATRERMRGRARCQSARVARRSLRWRVGGCRRCTMHSTQLTCSPATVPAPVTGPMADSEHDETFEDAESSGDEQQR
eukprot:2784632-Prymnesium_polylepis.1